MSDELYQKFRIYLTEGLLGIEENQLFGYLDSKGYTAGSEKRNEAIDAYMKVTHDPILGPMVPELSSYDLNTVNIKELYNARKRNLELNKQPEPKPETPITPEGTEQAPVAQEESVEPVQDPTVSMVNDINRYNMVSGNNEVDARIAETQKVMVQEPDNIVGEPVGLGKKKTLSFKKSDGAAPAIDPDALVPKEVPANKTLSSIGYANIVLMSIIVIIIVAIVCVFIFVK